MMGKATFFLPQIRLCVSGEKDGRVGKVGMVEVVTEDVQTSHKEASYFIGSMRVCMCVWGGVHARMHIGVTLHKRLCFSQKP